MLSHSVCCLFALLRKSFPISMTSHALHSLSPSRFNVYILMVKSWISLYFSSVHGERYGSNPSLLQADSQVFQHLMAQLAIFPPTCAFGLFVKDPIAERVCGCVPPSSVLFLCSSCLSLCQYRPGFTLVGFGLSWKSGIVMPPAFLGKQCN